MASLLAEELQQDPAELLALLERKGLNASEAQTLWNGTLKPRPGQPG
jgi:hypothetical protein